MKIKLDENGNLVVNGQVKHCMYAAEAAYCSTRCAQFSEPMEDGAFINIYICHGKCWYCEFDDFTNEREKVSDV